VNFGISYGISPFGLSESIKIPYEKAQELIDLYFLRYPQVKKFIEESIAFAKENGYVKTLLEELDLSLKLTVKINFSDHRQKELL